MDNSGSNLQHLNHGVMGKKVHTNMPIHIGENGNCLPSGKVTHVPDMFTNHKPRNGILENQNGHSRYEEITTILGLKRMNSETGSDITEFASARGSTADLESGAYVSPSYVYRDENGDFGHGSRRANGEMNFQPDSLRPSAPPLNDVVPSQSSIKMKFLCSFGGKILPRPSDGTLRYIGGDTRIISIRNNLLWDELVKKTSEICKVPHSIKYQLPGEDLDALISVSSDEDLQNMMEEYQGVEKLGGSQRLRIFLIPLCESENTCPINANLVQRDSPDYEYVVMLNGMGDPGVQRNNEQLIDSDKVQPETNIKESESLVNSSAQPPPPFSATDHYEDTSSGFTSLYKEARLAGLDVTSISLNTSQLPADNNNFNIAGYCRPSQEEEISRNSRIPLKSDYSQPSEAVRTQFYNPVSDEKDCRVSLSFGKNDDDGEKYSLHTNSTLKERVFHSVDLLSGSNDSISYQHGMPHAFSDSKLQEHNTGASMYSSHEGLSPSFSSDFAIPQFSIVVSSGLQVKPLHLPQNSPHDENSAGCLMLNEIDKSNPPVSSVECFSETPSITLDPFSILSIKNPHVASLSQETKLRPSVDEATDPNMQLQESLSDIIFKGLKTGYDESCLIKGEECVNKLLHGSNLEVAASFPASKKEPTATNFSTNLLCDFTDDLVSNESPLLQSGACQNNFNLFPSTVYANSYRKEVTLIEEDFVCYPDQRDFSSRVPGLSEEMQMLSYNFQNKGIEQDQRDFMVHVTDSVVTGMEPSSAPGLHIADTSLGENFLPQTAEAESVLSPSGSENGEGIDENRDQSITDAMVTEMEAEIYGLQIIKNSDLEEMRELGSGTYGTVFHGKWRGTDVAIKRIKSSCFAGRTSEKERLTNDFWREACILSNLHHPNVVAFYGVVPDGAGGTLATVTEYMANGSLRSILLKKDRSLDRRKKLIIAMDAAFGMEYLHSKNIVHFDLKCDNLLVNLRDPHRPICKVGDFGLSRIKRNTLVSGGVRGTLPWMAPELLDGSSSKISEKIDVFSFGITMWEIITGEEPYANMHCGAIIGGILKNTLRPPIPEKCDPEWRKLVEHCWSSDPDARPSFTEIANRLRSMGQNNVAK